MSGLERRTIRQGSDVRVRHSIPWLILLAVLTSLAVSLLSIPVVWFVRSPLDSLLVAAIAFAGSMLLLTLCLILFFCIPPAVFGFLNGLPLIVKELLEQSARRRTWWLRSVYALLAFLAAVSMSAATLHRNWAGSPFQILGQGSELFAMFTFMQFFGIYLFMPAMTSPLLTSEKERDTLSLLFLTRLSPWGIIVGKLVSRLIPMFLLLALSLPLSAFAYSLGGFEQSLIWMTAWILCLTVLQVATLGLMCSAFFRTTVGAFIATYVFGFLMLFGPIMFDGVTHSFRDLFESLRSAFGTQTVFGFQQYTFSGMFFAPMVLFENGPGRFGGSDVWLTLLRSIPILVISALFLLLTRVFIVSRAFVERRNLLLVAFRKLDRVFWQLNERFGRGVVISGGSEKLPKSQPVAWREVTKKTLGTTRYLVRVFIGLEFPVLFICILSVGGGSSWNEMLAMLQFMVWIIAILLICVHSVSLFAAERTHQTLDVLLTTPMTNRDLFRQKLRGLQRLTFVVSVPLLTVYIFEGWLRHDAYSWNRYGGSDAWRNGLVQWPVLCYLGSGIVTMLIYFPMIAGLATLAGLKLKTQTRAIFAALGLIVAWNLLPLMVLGPMFEIYNVRWSNGGEYYLMSIPAVMIGANEFREFTSPWKALFANSIWYGGITVGLWTMCLLGFDGMLGRFDSLNANVKTRLPRSGLPPLTATGG
jgi:ABC-type transport system involved in multi-copper enzyme maturation permease subunit